MEKHVNNYGGLNKDAGRDVIAPNFYIDAKDIRISTDRGESMGSWTNIKGNKVSFTIPTEQPEGSPFGTWTATNPAIIGHTTIRNKIIVFVADDGGTQGWIYEIQYNNSTLDLLPGYPSLVYYNALLNFSKDWPIEALGHYESDCIQKVYWTDYNNFLRSLNITATDLPLISPGLLDMFPDVTYHQPLLKILTGGGNMMSGVYQVAYRLVTLDGKETLISPPSNFFHIVAQSETNVQSANYFGDNADYNTFKSIQIELNTSDYGEFDKVEFIVIRYPAFNAIPEVLSVEYITINNQPSVTFLYNGDEGSAYPIELVTFITKSYPFKTAKTITKKDSSMVIANIKGAVVSVQDILDPSDTFDAKTGRYNDLGLLPHIGGSETDLLNNAFNITTDSDATRGFNSDAHWDPAWHTSAYQYKYRSNGSTLGGEGPNISYKFHLEPMTIDGNNPTPGFGNVSNIPDGAHYLNDGYGGYANTTYPSFASPFLSGLLRGYKRGETYRFGIVFYTNKGESTFVEYIGDIKFPELGDRNDEVTCNVGGVDYDYYPIALQTTNNDTIGLSLGIQFELDFASCPSLLTQVTSYQIVRVLRAEKDQRRLSQGVIKTFWSVPAGTPADNVDFDLRIPEGVDNGRALHLFPYAGNNSAINGAFTTLVDHKWEPFPQGLTVPKPDLDVDGAYYIKGDYLGFYSPEISYNYGNSRNLIAATSGNNCLLITGAYTNTAQTALDDPKDLSDIDLPQSCRTYGSTMKSTYPVFASDPLQRIKKFVNSKFIEMPDTADYKVTVTPLFAGGPTTGTVGIGQYYMRNYYAIPDYKDSVATLNDPKGSNTGGANLRPEIYKSGSGVIGNIAALILDPLYGTSIPGMGTPGEDFVDYFRSPSITGWNVFFEPIYGGIDPADPITFAPDITLYNSSTPIVDILVPKSETYGGYTLNSLQTNIFSQASPVIDIVHLNPKVYGGDTFITMFTFQAGLVEFNKAFYAKNDSVGNDLYRQSNSVTELFPVESRLNIDLACGSTLKTQAQYTHNGSYYPILKQEITRSTWSQALQVMHVHFPDLKNDISYQDIWHILSEYNDIIHWLESILLNVWGNIPYATNSSLFRVTLDFNKSTNTFLPIPLDAYTLCEPAAQFGDLLLHYTHVGKHAQELFSVNDLVCPESQFVPQTLFNASCRMLFTDYFYDTVQKKENLKQRWEQFYIERGGYEFWKYEVSDPRIQFGYLKIGSLSQIVMNKNQYPIPKTVLELVKFRRKISESNVIDWNIRGA